MSKTFNILLGISLSLLHPFFLSAQLVEEPIDFPTDPTTKAKVLQENVKSQVLGNNTFALELFYRLKARQGNVLVAPYAVSSTMAMAYAGAVGGSQGEMQSTFHYLSQNESLYEVFEFLNRKFTKSWYEGPNESRLFLANSLWIQRDLKILPKFLDMISKYFKSSLKQADFMRNPESARVNINSWVKERTQGRLPEMVKSEEIAKTTRLLLISPVFMKAVWRHAFDPILSVNGVFFIDKVHSVAAHMMTTTANFPFLQTDTFQVVEFPYRSSSKDEPQFSMIILLPRNTHDATIVESVLTVENFDTIVQSLKPRQVIATIPKFKLSSIFRLDQTLQNMGLSLPFSPFSDFSELTSDHNLSISGIFHKSVFSIDEKGTEAIAATALSLNQKPESRTEPAVVFKADHPFIFLIVDRSTNSIIFLGRIQSPEQ